MALTSSKTDREFNKFRDAGAPNTKVAVTIEQDPSNPIPITTNESPDLPDGYTAVNYFDETTSVSTSVLTSIISLTVSDEFLLLSRIEFGGSNKAEYQLILNSSVVGRKRTYYTYLNESFECGDLKLLTGETLEVKVIHERPYVGDFEARIIGVTKA